MRSLPSGWNTVLAKLGFKRRKSGRRNICSRRLRFESLEYKRMLATITVNTDLDVNDENDGLTTLREAVEAANPSGGDSINFALNPNSTIALDSALGEIAFNKSLTIDGGTLGLTIDAGGGTNGMVGNGDGFRIFNITDTTSGASPPEVTMIGMKLTGGDVSDNGGAIRSAGILTLQDMQIIGNAAQSGGGLFLNVKGSGTSQRVVLSIENSLIDDNQAFSSGGGIAFQSGSSAGGQDIVMIEGSTISNNETEGVGGGLHVQSNSGGNNEVIISTSEIKLNESQQDGGGINFLSNTSNLSILAGSTISGNTSTFQTGGGVNFSGTNGAKLRVEESTISGNKSASNGGGIYARLATSSKLIVTDSDIIDNEILESSGKGNGGGIYTKLPRDISNMTLLKSVAISRSLISGNTAFGRGGGLYTGLYQGHEVLIEESRFTNNIAKEPTTSVGYHGSGGGIYAYLHGLNYVSSTPVPRFTITGSSIDNNKADLQGGGIFVCGKYSGEFLTWNTTVSSNQTLEELHGIGGGIFIGRAHEANLQINMYLRNLTITENVSATAGGLWIDNVDNMPVSIANSIISKNFDHDAMPNNLVGRVDRANFQYNLLGSGSIVRDLNGVLIDPINNNNPLPASNQLDEDQPKLEGLDFNGGRTPTHRPKNDSPVVDAGSNSLASHPLDSSPFVNDQRGFGFPRLWDIPVIGGNGDDFIVDIGAYEIGLAKVADVKIDRRDTLNDWAESAEVSMKHEIEAGRQYYSIAKAGANTIEIVFTEAVDFPSQAGSNPGSELRLVGGLNGNTDVVFNNFVHAAGSNVAIWTFNDLPFDKYAIRLSDAVLGSLTQERLDGDFNNDDNGAGIDNTPDDKTDDIKRPFIVGDGAHIAGSMSGEFRLHFAYLPGDYVGDGLVDGADELSWQRKESTSDGDGNGIVDATTGDYDVYSDNFGNNLPLTAVGFADFNDDEIVNSLDLMIWQESYGLNGGGDGDGDGDTDGSDFLIWISHYMQKSAWYVPHSGMAGALTTGLPPQVLNVIISGSQSVHDPFSFDTVDGSGDQLATVPVGLADTISIVFSEGVNVSAEALIVVGLTTANVPQLAEFSYDAATHTATWRFEGWALGDNYLLYLSDSITDTDGNFLDGEWTNPASMSTTNSLVSTFPSGDGVSGGSFNFVMTLLPGDANLDGVVNTGDLSILSNHWEQNGMFEQGDFDGDGFVGNSDLDILVSNWQRNLRNIFILADLDADGDVDDEDLDVLYQNYGMTNATWADGDLNGDGVVSDLDVDLAFAQYGLWLNRVA